MVSAPLSADIGSFQQHGSAFWDVQGPYRTLHQINPARLQFVERFVVLSGLRVLDVGCGGGILSEALAERGASVLGIDLAESALQARCLMWLRVWRCWSMSPTRRRSCAIFMRC